MMLKSKASMQSQSRLPVYSLNSYRARFVRVSAWLRLVFFRKLKYRLVIKKLGIIYIQYIRTRGAATRGGGGICPPPILKSRVISYILVPPYFYHQIYFDWLVSPTYKIVPAPLVHTHVDVCTLGGRGQ